MKNAAWVVIVICLACMGGARARFVSLTTEPIATIFGDYHVQAEFRISDVLSVVVPAGLYAPNWSPFQSWTGLDPAGFNGIAFPAWIAGGGLGPRLYPLAKAHESGLYFQFLFFAGAGQTFGLSQSVSLIQQRYSVGYAWLTDIGIVVEVFGGFTQNNFSHMEGQGFLPNAGVNVGYTL